MRHSTLLCLLVAIVGASSLLAQSTSGPELLKPATKPATVPIKDTPALARPKAVERPKPNVAGVDHVVVIGIDGLSVDGVRRGAKGNLKRFMEEGAYTLNARAMIPTVSGPNWMSIICSAPPSYHGVTTNEWLPEKHAVPPLTTGPGGIFPTMFSTVWEQDSSAILGFFHEWKTFGVLVERDFFDRIESYDSTPRVAGAAADWFKATKPRLMMVHLDVVDHAGHSKGWGTPEYLAAVGEADDAVGTILNAVRDAGLEHKTVVFLVTDHGGKNKSHGGNSLEELSIPWMAMGAGVKKGVIEAQVSNADTAATVAWVLGMKPPEAWTQRPVRAAFR